MVFDKTLFISTYTLICLRIRETSFLDDGQDSRDLGPLHAIVVLLVTPQAPLYL